MARVAANQDRSESNRSHFVYLQHAHIESRKGAKPMCVEVTDSRVVPSPHGSQVLLLKLEGRYLRKHAYVSYTTLPVETEEPQDVATAGDIQITLGNEETDRSLVESMRSNLTRDNTRDGFSAQLFPLTSKVQADYMFQQMGHERMNGHNVYRVAFHPKNKDDFTWKGEAYIDDTAFEPVVVTTEMARKIPILVRTLLGTSLSGIGYTVTYEPQADGIWFPVSFGTEFKVRLLFLFGRDILIEAKNGDFERTHVTSTIVESTPVP